MIFGRGGHDFPRPLGLLRHVWRHRLTNHALKGLCSHGAAWRFGLGPARRICFGVRPRCGLLPSLLYASRLLKTRTRQHHRRRDHDPERGDLRQLDHGTRILSRHQRAEMEAALP